LPEDPVKTPILTTSIALIAAVPNAYARPGTFPDIVAAVTFGAGGRANGSGSVHRAH
jgi:hypothetical protein